MIGWAHSELVEEMDALPIRDDVREKWMWNNEARLMGGGYILCAPLEFSAIGGGRADT